MSPPRPPEESRAPPAFVAWREMHADIAGAECAQNGVGDRVQADIGIRMTEQSVAVGHFHTAEGDMVAFAERVNVETRAGADIRERVDQHRFGGAASATGTRGAGHPGAHIVIRQRSRVLYDSERD